MFVMGLILYFLPIPIWIYIFYCFIGSVPYVLIRNNSVLRLLAGSLMFYLGYKISAYLFP
ncbi:hypothetical protein GCM10007423_01180 [Dyadobacter endophyticus]|uniref:LysE type translocator n=1 Tax=Dyadobacter endophyticus TaxID=1749036 RepID=A0ABQ1YDM3_9BACT|nr:hypothetical protein GCM10007423_01180 [Dyadobacter endophyticus]